MTDTRHIRQTFNRAAGLELRSTWQSTRAYKRHCHPQLSIGAIVEGQTCCVSHGNAYVLVPGDLIVIPAYAPHSCNPVAGKPRSYHMLYIDTDLPLALQVIRDPTLFKHFLAVVGTMSSASVETLLSALPRCAGEMNAPRSTSQQVQQALLSDLAAPPSLDELAQRFSLRKETLIRTFRQDTGLTPGSFLNISRVEYAKARLRAGDDIADVGYQSGFADQSHFHKTFVNYTAATPRQYATGRSISDNNQDT
ncbi:AraC family transcriptional regulator [Enterobacter hormaechei subsp. steigerwaltii]|jgi:AraC-like DNA-binding protein|uniref:AraC family transcriptional regulator n=1 Tax=Enterobacter hormaechei TaxID=158836 RepID=UPI00063C4B96|nr:AraC family transcriptional regulator [Enterobacter hormaechei]KLF83453.1 AraC family transcriptional regulator [Enterobacter hormaechei subsp. steigerwaltii]TZG29775.1 AraC family transcriptional regulator [Enterobacter sp. RVSM5a]HAV1487290.1 AraC family transcriptional regulator [Enterobacter hormaechei subsp. steigerwaltii]